MKFRDQKTYGKEKEALALANALREKTPWSIPVVFRGGTRQSVARQERETAIIVVVVVVVVVEEEEVEEVEEEEEEEEEDDDDNDDDDDDDDEEDGTQEVLQGNSISSSTRANTLSSSLFVMLHLMLGRPLCPFKTSHTSLENRFTFFFIPT
ncbi:hypothetical protein HZH68_010368 [Vespula germanica]|uniref:Uncharacterized protein n=1 Tax=Vespula germanica TaxID=30212 RepID=A0A834JS01_VESGE|nr:hypothetical protein HZH68_010368 [Vespula germanica]